MICYYYPPLITSGVSRSLHFSKLLPQFNWTPLVLTVKNSKDPWVEKGSSPELNHEVARTVEFNLAGICDFFHGVWSRFLKLLGIEATTNYFREFICLPDSQIAWLTTIPGLFLNSRYQLIYVTCSPFSSAVSGVFIKLLTNKPLVVDFRDPWTLNPHSQPSAIRKFINEHLERFVIKQADALILNTEGAKRDYCKKYPAHTQKIHCIPNGYDELTPVSVEDYQHSLASFTIAHVGTFYGNRSPRLLLEAVSSLPTPCPKFLQVGQNHPDLDSFRNSLEIKVTGMVSREEAINQMSTASLLYLKQGFEIGVSNYTAVAAKTYEYLATGLPILLDAPPGDNAEIIKQYGINSHVVTTGNVNDLREALLSALNNQRNITPKVHPEFTEKYSRTSLAKSLCNLFDSLMTR